MYRTMLGALAPITLALSLAGCGGETAEPVDAANPDAPAGISATEGRLNLPAVEGNPGALYFNVVNDSDRDRMIRAVSIMGAGSAIMHQMGTWNLEPSMEEVLQLNVPAGETIAFEPGDYHVMAMDIDGSLEIGGETEATLTFVGGDKVSFPVTILGPGEMPAMDSPQN